MGFGTETREEGEFHVLRTTCDRHREGKGRNPDRPFGRFSQRYDPFPNIRHPRKRVYMEAKVHLPTSPTLETDPKGCIQIHLTEVLCISLSPTLAKGDKDRGSETYHYLADPGI